MTEQEVQEIGKLPLNPAHICFDKGHSMFAVYTIHNWRSSFGEHKCSRCGFIESWQYDFVGSNPMYNQNNER